MKVRELIAELSKFDPDAEVHTEGCGAWPRLVFTSPSMTAPPPNLETEENERSER